MNKFVGQRLQQQEQVNAYFQSQSLYWKDIYTANDVYAEIHRDRYRVVLDWIDSLALAPGSQVLEIGCGAGFMAIALAQRGFRVHAIDSTDAMIEQARRHAEQVEVTNLLSLSIGDTSALTFKDESFDLVLAIGVIPWIEQAELAMQEMARVTRSGGYVLLTADNQVRLNNLLDPWLNPLLPPLKWRVKKVLDRVGLRRQSLQDVGATAHSRRFIDKALAHAELRKMRSLTLGFGPFSLFRCTVLPAPLGIALHHRLQRLADRNVPLFRSTGAQYLVLSKKSGTTSLVQSASTKKSMSASTLAL